MVFTDWMAVSGVICDGWVFVVLLSVPRGPDPVSMTPTVFTAALDMRSDFTVNQFLCPISVFSVMTCTAAWPLTDTVIREED